MDDVILLSHLTKIYTISTGQMLNRQITNIKNKTPKQPILSIFGLFFHQKKNCIFIIPEQPRYSFKNSRNIRTKNRILFFCCQTYRYCTCSKWPMQTLAPTNAAIILCLDSTIFVSHRTTSNYKHKNLLSEILSDGFHTGNHRVLKFQP